MMDFLMQLFFTGVLFTLILVLVKIFLCIPCRYCKCFAVSIRFNSNGVSAVDTTIPLPGSQTANAVITENGVPIDPPAVFDADPTWTGFDASIISVTQTSVQTVLVTALALGQTTLTVDGLYQGNAVHGEAVVTVTQGPSGFAVDIQWVATPGVSRR